MTVLVIRAMQHVTIIPIIDFGTKSPYPVVVVVTTPSHTAL
jgi:hypothetical protein